MKRTLLSILILVVCAGRTTAQEKPHDNRAAVTVMTFNLRFASPNPPNAWPQRRPVMKECIQKVNPDVIGTQEGVYHQLKDIAADLPGYDWIGLGRDGGSRGEFMAVFYRTERLEPLEFDHFWLSDTPEVIGSTTWGNTNRRMVTWVRFRELRTKRQFYVVNTHFDHQIQPAREKSAELLVKRVDAMKTMLPVVLVGDFNATAGKNKAYDTIASANFTDTWVSARERRGEVVGTFHNYRPPTPDGPRIDWIMTRGDVAADATEIITFTKEGQAPSDHFPVAAWLRL